MSIHTKIVATVAPERPIHNLANRTSEDDVSYLEMVAWLVQSGVDIFRLNMSHASKNGERERAFLDAYRQQPYLWENHGRHVAILGDLQGPKIRIGTFDEGATTDGEVELVPRNNFVLHAKEEVKGNQNEVAVRYEAGRLRACWSMSRTEMRSGSRLWP